MTIYCFHIGHGKTGTSAFQTYLTQNKQFLSANGIFYPTKINLSHKTKTFHGNLNVRDKNWPLQLNDFSKMLDFQKYKKIIYSSENIFWYFDDNVLELIEKFVKLEKTKFFIVLRDPVAMLISSYSQAIKTGTFLSNIEDYYEVHEHHLHRAALIIEMFEKHNLNFCVYNYTVEKNNIVRTLAEQICSEVNFDKEIVTVSKNIVNRSLTYEEVTALRLIGKNLGRTVSRSIGVTLAHTDKNKTHTQVSISRDLAKRIVDDYEKPLTFVNKYLSEEKKIVPNTSDYISEVALEPEHLAIELVEDMLSWITPLTLNENFTFSEEEYLSANPDVKAAGANPYRHFLKSGIREGRSPGQQPNIKTK